MHVLVTKEFRDWAISLGGDLEQVIWSSIKFIKLQPAIMQGNYAENDNFCSWMLPNEYPVIYVIRLKEPYSYIGVLYNLTHECIIICAWGFYQSVVLNESLKAAHQIIQDAKEKLNDQGI